ncbi:MAG TPA: HAD family acid phosphatase [Marmoricola sp.]|nr:hypothetical protein [Nocardioidaceae bacterium]MCB8992520.1 hypothetical protein [Nocardioidaceae bacterium]MCO5323612.1 hypothetical protein [Nocardioidaceae bacterium]HMU36931.1 HAD family acid phosphatase [Marmoricola sp.]HRV67837.1 HAD family acid phosphatase [Marmoricola sp.]
MKSRIFAASLCTALLLVLLPGAAQAKGRTSKPLPTKRQWYAQVNKAMKPAVPHLRARAIRGGKLAINLDIDNVSLATYYNRKAPIPATLRLARVAKRLGVAVFFNSGRNASKLAAVIPRLEAAGFKARGYCGREDGEKLADSKQRCRQSFIDRGYTIVLNVGNNKTDFIGTNYEKAIRLPNYGRRLS